MEVLRNFIQMIGNFYLFQSLDNIFKSGKTIWRIRKNIQPRETQVTAVEDALLINYPHLGITYTKITPYDVSRVPYLSSIVMTHISDTGVETDRTQQPGVAYTFSARDLGGGKLIGKNIETGEIFEYLEDQMPLWVEELKPSGDEADSRDDLEEIGDWPDDPVPIIAHQDREDIMFDCNKGKSG
jgi:hypothetical protein